MSSGEPGSRPHAKEPVMADVNRVERPLSPHISIYRWKATMVTSILTRITGNALLISFALGVWWLAAAATSDAAFAQANALATSWFGDLVFTVSLWGIWYHYLAGLRHLWWDALHGLDRASADLLSWACLIGSAVLTVITLFLV
jgi:succinate dehydrogenase / fumarate reductase cytochrome b subunit